MRRGYCIGGPCHGKLVNVNNGARMLDAATMSQYVWLDGQWLYEPPAPEQSKPPYSAKK